MNIGNFNLRFNSNKKHKKSKYSLDDMSKKELINLAKELGVSSNGKKSDIIYRIIKDTNIT